MTDKIGMVMSFSTTMIPIWLISIIPIYIIHRNNKKKKHLADVCTYMTDAIVDHWDYTISTDVDDDGHKTTTRNYYAVLFVPEAGRYINLSETIKFGRRKFPPGTHTAIMINPYNLNEYYGVLDGSKSSPLGMIIFCVIWFGLLFAIPVIQMLLN